MIVCDDVGERLWASTVTNDEPGIRSGVLRLEAFLRSQHYSGGKSAAQLLGKLRRAPQSCPGDAHMQALRAIVLGLVAAVKALAAQIKALEREIAAVLRKHPDGPIFRSLFKDAESFVCAAELLAEIGDCRARYPTADALAAAAGQSAVARESGRYKKACFRRACNANLRTAVCVLADTTRRWHPWAQDRYAAARARRQEHAHAIRTLTSPCSDEMPPREHLAQGLDTGTSGAVGARRLRRPSRRAGLDSVVCAQRAICVRGSPGGSGGCAPGLHPAATNPGYTPTEAAVAPKILVLP